MEAGALVPRSATDLAVEMLSESRAVALIGPRQSGKSTLAKHLLAPRWRATYLTLDDAGTRHAALDDPTNFIARVSGPTIIDEIQRAPDLMLAMKIRLDQDNTPGQFLIAGSANLTQIRTVKDALPGRVLYLDIWPLSQAEIEGWSHGAVDQLMDGVIPTIEQAPIGPSSYLDRFARGGFPGLLGRSSRVRRQFFDSYLDSIVERDIPDLAALRSLDGPARILRLVATRSAGLLNVASLARDLHMDNKTVDHHLRILRDLMLVRLHQPWFANLGSRESKSPKVYITDPGLLAALAGADPIGIQRNSNLLGSFLETAVCMEIVRLAATAGTHIETFHYRDKKQREVDIVLERSDGTIVCIEVKAGATALSSDFRSLRYLRDGVGDKFAAGIVLHCGERTLPFGDRLAAVPISALWTPSRP